MTAAALLASGMTHDPARLRELARELLSRPPYTAGRQDGLLARVFAAIRDVVAEVLSLVLRGLTGSTTVAWLVVVVGTTVLAVVVWRATRGTRRETSRPEAVVPDSARSAADWMAEADAALAAGRRTDAVRCLYAALVARLVEAGDIEERAGRTVRELDAELARRDPDLARPVAQAGRCFEAVCYGGEAVRDEDLTTLHGALGHLPVAAR